MDQERDGDGETGRRPRPDAELQHDRADDHECRDVESEGLRGEDIEHQRHQDGERVSHQARRAHPRRQPDPGASSRGPPARQAGGDQPQTAGPDPASDDGREQVRADRHAGQRRKGLGVGYDQDREDQQHRAEDGIVELHERPVAARPGYFASPIAFMVAPRLASDSTSMAASSFRLMLTTSDPRLALKAAHSLVLNAFSTAAS